MRHWQTWKAASACDEAGLARIMQKLAGEIHAPAWILLEGPMGAGKSTAARALIPALGGTLRPEGSPTFALAHEYPTQSEASLIHLDLYRLEDEADLQAAGISAYFWETSAVVLAEWVSRFPTLEQTLQADSRTPLYRIQIEPEENPSLRTVTVTQRVAAASG